MDSTFSDSLMDWIDRLVEGGWIDLDQARRLRSQDDAGPEDWFSGNDRPLIVAFFGGTGVGKSTLLNRLAGEKIAKTGIERPTSREITVFLHRDLSTDRLQRHLPLERLQIARHNNDNRRRVVWIDMPDIDSIEESNRRLVLRCLPFVDVLIYVVSPERYRDDSGWQLLLQHGQRHAWLFVMNHWDQGDEVQIEDFRTQLREAGFPDPIILRCDSREDLSERLPDDFGKLEEILTHLVRQGGIERLERHGLQQRLVGQRRALAQILERLGRPEQGEKLKQLWRRSWRRTREDLEPTLDLPVKALAAELAGKGLRRLEDDGDGEHPLLRDLWVRKHLEDTLDRLVVEAAEAGLATEPLRRHLDGYRDRIEVVFREQIRRSVAAALARPGRGVRRFLLWLTGVLRYLLPFGASVWVGWQVVARYYEGMLGGDDWLGIDFAVHSLLLIGLAWLVPHLLHRLLQPSLEKAARYGIHQGIDRAFEQVEADVEQVLDRWQSDWHQLHQWGKRLLEIAEPSAVDSTVGGLLGRLIFSEKR